MEDNEAKAIIESILFMSGETMTLDSLRTIIEVDKYNTERLVRELINEYTLRNGGLLILEVAEGFQMATSPACSPWVRKLLATSVPKKLSQSSLETMAIIAYKQPIIKAEIEAIRGVNSDGVVKTLLEKKLVKILGRKEAPGRPLLYGTTSEFLQYFGLKDLSELPTLKEFAEVDMPEPPEGMPEDQDVSETTSEGPPAADENEDKGEEILSEAHGHEDVMEDVLEDEHSDQLSSGGSLEEEAKESSCKDEAETEPQEEIQH